MFSTYNNKIKSRNSLESIKKEALEQVINILDKYNLEYWLDCGMLLGAIRDNKFLEWESDIDLGIFAKNFHKMESIRRDLSNKGFKVFYSKWREHYHIVKKGIRIDFLVYQINNDESHHYVSKVGKIGNILDYFLWIFSMSSAEEKISMMPKIVTKLLIQLVTLLPKSLKKGISKNLSYIFKKSVKKIKIIIPSRYFTNLKSINFYGLNVKIPSKTEEYLEYRYGKDWKIPQKNWKYKKNTN